MRQMIHTLGLISAFIGVVSIVTHSKKVVGLDPIFFFILPTLLFSWQASSNISIKGIGKHSGGTVPRKRRKR